MIAATDARDATVYCVRGRHRQCSGTIAPTDAAHATPCGCGCHRDDLLARRRLAESRESGRYWLDADPADNEAA